MKLYREHKTDLVDDLRRGGFFLSDALQKNVLHAVQSRLMPLPGRADEIAELPGRPSAARIADLWPRLKLVVTWTGGSAGIAVSALRKELDPSTRIHELGYLSSEFRGTITLGRRPGSGLPTFDNHFFEFVERDRWDRGDPVFLTLDQLRKGSDYYIFVTTPSGLYRYFINDLVRVTGFLHRTPLLKFMQKGKGVTNITGEKLYEAQVLNAVNQVAGELGRAVRFVMMVADEEASTYRLYVEMDAGEKISAASFAAQVDARLGTLNLEYAAKRESGRLHPLLACFLRPGTEDTFRQICVRQGQREGQFKTLALTYASKISFDFDAYVQT
jgi:hypothetical protein